MLLDKEKNRSLNQVTTTFWKFSNPFAKPGSLSQHHGLGLADTLAGAWHAVRRHDSSAT